MENKCVLHTLVASHGNFFLAVDSVFCDPMLKFRLRPKLTCKSSEWVQIWKCSYIPTLISFINFVTYLVNFHFYFN
jgi:hypothetical protein